MEFFTDEIMRGLLASSLETAELGPDGFGDVGTGPGSAEGSYIDWLTITDGQQSIVDDVSRIRTHPLVPATIPVYGYIYDVSTDGWSRYRKRPRPHPYAATWHRLPNFDTTLWGWPAVASLIRGHLWARRHALAGAQRMRQSQMMLLIRLMSVYIKLILAGNFSSPREAVTNC